MKKILLSISLLVASVSFAQLNNGLIVHYNFNGDANDAGSNGLHGAINGATLTADANGDADMAYEFGNGTYIDIQDTSHFNMGNGSITLSVWFRTDATYGYQTILDNGTDAYQSGFTLGLSWGNTGNIFFGVGTEGFFNTANCISIESVNAYNDGLWHNVAVSVDKTSETVVMYVDGAPAEIALFTAFGTPGGTLAADNKSLNTSGVNYLITSSEPSTLIGASNNYQSVQRFWGALDEIRIYGRGISANEAAQLTDPNVLNGIADKLQANASMKVFPNPAADAFTVKLNDDAVGLVHAKLISMQGAVVKDVVLQNGTTIDVSNLLSGIYILNIEQGNNIYTEKLTVY